MRAAGDGTSGPRRSVDAAPEDLRIELLRIEHDLNEGRYRPGPWERFIRELKRQPARVRSALADEVSRVSRKVHLRSPRKTISACAGVATEIFALALGAGLLAFAVHQGSSVVGLAGAFLWIMSLQPLAKITMAAVFGVGYEYAYLLRGEPRFKMRFGSYVARPRWQRVVLHLSGTIGSPIGAWAAARIISARMPGTARIVMAVFWLVVAINIAAFVAGLSGIRRFGSIRTSEGSGGAAGLEIREAFARSREATR